VADVAEHFRFRWHEVVGGELPAASMPAEAGEHQLQLVQTIPEKVYPARPHGEFRILESYVRALRSARRFVYLESQFLWSPELVELLAAKLRRPPEDDFRLVVLLPARPKSGADDTRGQLGVLAEADDGAGRLLACPPYQRGGGAARPSQVGGPAHAQAVTPAARLPPVPPAARAPAELRRRRLSSGWWPPRRPVELLQTCRQRLPGEALDILPEAAEVVLERL